MVVFRMKERDAKVADPSMLTLADRSFKEGVAHTHDERLKVKAQAYLEGLDAVDGAVRQDDSIEQP